MSAFFYNRIENNLNDKLHGDFLNYPNFKKFIDNNNNNDNENFEESRKYIHRVITKTLNANSVKVSKKVDERILQGNSNNKFCLKNMENRNNKKEFSYSSKNNSQMRRNRNLNTFTHGNSNRSNEENGQNDQNTIGYENNPTYLSNSSSMNNQSYPNNPIGMNTFSLLDNHTASNTKEDLGTLPSTQVFHGNSNELSDNLNHRAINYSKKNEMSNESKNRINEALLLKEKKNLLKHELFFSEPRNNMHFEHGDNRTFRNYSNIIFTNEEKLGFPRSSSTYNHPYELVKGNGIIEDVSSSVFSSNEFTNMKTKTNGSLKAKGEDKKKKKLKEKKEKEKEKGREKEKLKAKECENEEEINKIRENDIEKIKKNQSEKIKKNENEKIKKNENIKKNEIENIKNVENETVKMGENEDIELFLKKQIFNCGKIQIDTYGDNFRSNVLYHNTFDNRISGAISSNNSNVNTSSIHSSSNTHRYEGKNYMSRFQKTMHAKKENNNYHRLESDTNKYKKYNNLKDNFHLNNSQRHFHTNLEQVKNKSEFFLTSDIDEKIYANNTMYDDYFTIENMETCEDKKEFFKKDGFNNKIKKDNMLGLHLCKNFDNKELLANKKKYFNFVENSNTNRGNNYRKNEYFNENCINEFSVDGILNEYSFGRKEYICNNVNGEIRGIGKFKEKMDTNSIGGKKLKDIFPQNNIISLNGVNFMPSPMYDNYVGHVSCNENGIASANADFGIASVHANLGNSPAHANLESTDLQWNIQNIVTHGNIRSADMNEHVRRTSADGSFRSTATHTENDVQEEENKTINTMMSSYMLKRQDSYYQNRNEIIHPCDKSKSNSNNIADVSSMLNSNNCSLNNENDKIVNNSRNASINIFLNKSNNGDNYKIFRRCDIMEPKDFVANSKIVSHVNGNINGNVSNHGNNNKRGEKNENEELVIKLFFGNLAPITTEKDMHNLFSNFGKCDSLIILKDRRSKSRGSGFVTFYNMEEAVNAIKNLNNKIILSGAHKPLEVRFPENKEEKKLRTKLLNAAKWKGKKIAPSGCLPISTEDILNQSSLHLNNSSGAVVGGLAGENAGDQNSLLNTNEISSYILSENDNILYDNKDVINFDCSNFDMFDHSNINHYDYSEDYSELRKSVSETTIDILNSDYMNGTYENSNIYNSSRQCSHKHAQEILSDDMNNNMNLLMQRKNYCNFLPNFLIDNKSSGKAASNSFHSFDESLGIMKNFNHDMDMEDINVTMNDFTSSLEINCARDEPMHKIVHEVVHELLPDLRYKSVNMEEDYIYHDNRSASSGSFLRMDDDNKGNRVEKSIYNGNIGNVSNFSTKCSNPNSGVMDEGDEGKSYFSNFCNGFQGQRDIMEDINNTFFSYLNHKTNVLNHNKSNDDEVYDEKSNLCRKGDFPGIDELEEINQFRCMSELEEMNEIYKREKNENSMRSLLLMPNDIQEVAKEDILMCEMHENNKSLTNLMDDSYNNMNIHYLGFDLSDLIQTNEDVLLPKKERKNKKHNTCYNNDEIIKDSSVNGKEIMIDDDDYYYQESCRDTNNMYKLNVGHCHRATADSLNDDLFGKKTDELNDNLSDEMLRNLINLYTQNKSSIITSHMFSYLNNVLCEINNALEIFNKFNVKASIKTVSDKKILEE
ncbi:hypothetical protein, conserved [Plasmodium gonderi]|uniref:RRM domain-containing protein n=1 Tax=Plasmodium gonderi TaxID=77519 RepID=A0A1Y1JIF5_PLAGO|nr:hypothetical protein, conserved [Plasmodium gonderi]GAW81155.1 hypothetical protein, conserved [Plasmodium gonderi]